MADKNVKLARSHYFALKLQTGETLILTSRDGTQKIQTRIVMQTPLSLLGERARSLRSSQTQAPVLHSCLRCNFITSGKTHPSSMPDINQETLLVRIYSHPKLSEVLMALIMNVQFCLLVYNAVQSVENQRMFCRNMSPPCRKLHLLGAPCWFTA